MDEETVNISQKQSKPWEFKPGQSGNPMGKQKGTVSKRTQVATQIVATFDTKALERIKKLKDGNASEFKQYMDYILALLPKPKEIDIKGSLDPIKLIIEKTYGHKDEIIP